MTCKDAYRLHLVQAGVPGKDAEKILAMIRETDTPLAMTFSCEVETLPTPQTIYLYKRALDQHALKWIEANTPLAWYKLVFLPEDQWDEAIEQGKLREGL